MALRADTEALLVALAADSAGPPLSPVFSVDGTLAVKAWGLGWRTPRAGVVQSMLVQAGTAPTGSGVTVKLRADGTEIASATIAASGTQAGDSPAAAVDAGTILTIDVTAVGSTTAGADLVAQIDFR